DGACARIEGNVINARAGLRTFGVYLGSTGTFVNRNVIEAGCPTQEAVGIEADDSFARIQNNIVRGFNINWCSPGGSFSASSWALRVFNSAGSNEVDAYANDLLAYGANVNGLTCRALSITAFAGTAPPLGIYRNNILHGGFCPTAFAVEE